MGAPNVFKRWNINYDHIEATLAHDIGSKLVFDTNVAGGIHIEGTRGDNSMGGRDIHILTKKAGKQMMKVDISTTLLSSTLTAPSTEGSSTTTDSSLSSRRGPESSRFSSTRRRRTFSSASSTSRARSRRTATLP